VRSIVGAPDGSYALITLEDDSVLTVDIDSLAPDVSSAPEISAPDRSGETAEPEEAAPEVAAPAQPGETPESKEAAPKPEKPEFEPAMPASEPPESRRLRDAASKPIEDAAPEREERPVQVRGRISGDDLTVVIAVVLFGPDSMLREAARIVPGDDGAWSARGLESGRYRVQLDGGGSKVLVTDPPFLLIDIGQRGIVEAGEIRLMKAL
jgi:hypothetical protein